MRGTAAVWISLAALVLAVPVGAQAEPGLVDEQALGRWQSGLLRPNWKRKPAFGAFRAAIAAVRGGAVTCAAGGGRPAMPEESSTAGVRRAAGRR